MHVKVGDICTRPPVIARDSDSACYAAKLMRQYHVGSLIVVSSDADGTRPVGIITDRDLVVQALAEGIDLDDIMLEDIMARELIIAREEDCIYETIDCMSRNGVRRIPVTDQRGRLTGILSLDDIISLMASQLSGLASLINREQATEEKLRVVM